MRELWGFVRDSAPARRRSRYGDMEYDWEQRVNTTAGTVDWRTRLLGGLHSPYQPTEPALFHEMMGALPIDFREFTFIDIGSGKGRALLLASEYPFRRVVGIELIAELHRAAEENIRAYHSATQQCRQIESVMVDAREFEFPEASLVLYFFNPLSEFALSEVLIHLSKSLDRSPRPCWVIYHNPLLDGMFSASRFLEKAAGTPQYSIYRTVIRT
jgi:SAM-dependent methyltransferase